MSNGVNAIVLLAALVLASAASADAGETPGRYTMTPTENGFLRLDTEIGAVSLCMRKEGRWACESVTDNQSALTEQVARLKHENADLRRRLAEIEKRVRAGRPGLKLPSDKDVDKAMRFLERALRKFRDMAERLKEKPEPGTPL